MSQPGSTPNVSHCPECNATFEAPEDVAFVDMESETKIFGASKRFYLVACDHCGAAIGGGVAGAM
jgi:predicted nucleic-acid-binding Zn-ribbon protein